jgi:hypothetical protein
MFLLQFSYPFLLLVLLLCSVSTQCCTMRRLDQGTKDWWVCSDCESKRRCCQLLLQEANVDRDNCDTMLSTVPTKEGMFSLYTNTKRHLPNTERRPHLPSVVWEIRNTDTTSGDAWVLSPQRPFQLGTPMVHNVESTISSEGGMHRTWYHHLSDVEPGSTVLLLLFLTEHVYVDIEDLIQDKVQGGSLLQIHTSETISVELPAFDSPQHVIVLELKVHDASSHIILATKLHLRYLELSNNDNATTTIQLPHPVLWNARGRMPEPIIIQNVATGLAKDLWLITTISILCSLTGSLLLLKDLLQVSQWN